MSKNKEILVLHSKKQHFIATTIANLLSESGLNVRILLDTDTCEISELEIVILLWSKEAQKSLNLEIIWRNAFKNWQDIITISCDDTPSPTQLFNDLYRFDENNIEDFQAKLIPQIWKLSINNKKQFPIKISSGEFYSGSFRDQNNSYSNEYMDPKPFDLNYDYNLFRYPTLVSEYRVFLQEGYNTDSYWTKAGREWKQRYNISTPADWDAQSNFVFDRYPVAGISFFEAVAYCNWYTEYRSDGFRYYLPSETEWEKASRGGIKLIDNIDNDDPFRIWSWKGSWNNSLANTSESKKYKPISVDEHLVESYSPYGLIAMTGNLLEWCSNSLDNYPSTLAESVEGVQRRMARGGAYVYSQRDARCTRRMEFNPTQRQYMSFRLASIKQVG